MPAAYDTYDYPAYWIGRNYEHGCEIVALKSFLEKISKVNTILEIGTGFGRLTPTYMYRAKKIILTDPSSKLLAIARQTFKGKKIEVVQSCLENLPNKIPPHSVDLVIMVRVIHHIQDIDKAFKIVSGLLKKNGYFILEFANKGHFKATFKEIFKGNWVYPMEIEAVDKRSKLNIRKKTLPFYNYHPDIIVSKLKECNFDIVEKRSVSNIRGSFLNKIFPNDLLIGLSKYTQKPLAYLNFGPSIFLLSRKRDK